MPRPPDRGFPPPSKPLPAQGIRARSRRGAIGDSWWSQRFIGILESFELGGRLARARNYARRGQVLELQVEAGRIAGPGAGLPADAVRCHDQAEGSAGEGMGPGRSRQWPRQVGVPGPAPRRRDADRHRGGVCRLSPAPLPTTAADLVTGCTCPDCENPCKHIAAVYYLLADAFDDDPFLILAWRGRTRDQLLTRLLGQRSAGARRDDAEAWILPPVPVPALADCLDSFYDNPGSLPQPIPAQEGSHPDAILLELEDPPVDIRGHSLAELLRPAYPAMSNAARQRITGP